LIGQKFRIINKERENDLKVLIVENEIYLAQSISNRLQSLGFDVKLATCVKEAIRYYDESNFIHTVLLSTNLGDDFNSVIKKFKKSIIILLNSYINNDTVTTPLSNGAMDYILKPFLMDELIRKIEHYKEFERLKVENDVVNKYIDLSLNLSESVQLESNIKLPIIIKTNSIKMADKLVFQLAKELNKTLDFIDLNKTKVTKDDISGKNLTYLMNFDSINYQDKKNFIKNMINTNIVIVSIEDIDFSVENFSVVDIQSKDSLISDMKILPISEYVKLMIVKHQDKMPDIKISELLGISRKSLWEKRKKYGIEK
jgi:response regulator of citrate/malate metabolism